MRILDRLKLPEARDLADLDSDEAVAVHARIVRSKGFLQRLYAEFYRELGAAARYGDHGRFVEVGSGGGFIKAILPNAITSDVVAYDGIDKVFPADSMPFADDSVNGILILNCFHHFQDPRLVVSEFERVLVDGGSVAMIEPANTLWARFVYSRFHHEPFDLRGGWLLGDSGRLSCANGALPWIVFVRDRERFGGLFSSMVIDSITCHTPFSYLLSGGLTWRQLVPTSAYPIIRAAERVLSPFSSFLGMFMTIVISKRQR